MKRALLLFALLAPMVLVTACGKTEEAPVVQTRLSAPADPTDDAAWKAYLGQEINANRAGVTDNVYPYYLALDSDVLTPEDEAADKRTKYQRMVEQVNNAVLRTVLPGNMLAFGSPDSTKMADLIVTAFQGAAPNALKGSKVLFIGSAEDSERVKAAVEAAGATYVFVEAK
jgi:major membrane immunogen (membrane-anchored lipoprotein)